MIVWTGRLAVVLMLLAALLGPWAAIGAQAASPAPDGTAPVDGASVDVVAGPPAVDPAYLRDLLPIAVLGLAVGGAVGFELSRRGL